MRCYLVKIEVVEDLDEAPTFYYIEICADGHPIARDKADRIIENDAGSEVVAIYEKVWPRS